MRPLPRFVSLICLAALSAGATLPARAQGLGTTAADRLRTEQQNRVLTRSNPTLGRIDQRLKLHFDQSDAIRRGDLADLAEIERRRRLLMLERQKDLSEIETPSAAPTDGREDRTSVSGAPGAP